MLRRTSKRVKEVVDKMHLLVVVRLSRSFWDDTRNGTQETKLQVVVQCPALAHLNLLAEIQISKQTGQRDLQEFWDSAGSWCISISVAI